MVDVQSPQQALRAYSSAKEYPWCILCGAPCEGSNILCERRVSPGRTCPIPAGASGSPLRGSTRLAPHGGYPRAGPTPGRHGPREGHNPISTQSDGRASPPGSPPARPNSLPNALPPTSGQGPRHRPRHRPRPHPHPHPHPRRRPTERPPNARQRPAGPVPAHHRHPIGTRLNPRQDAGRTEAPGPPAAPPRQPAGLRERPGPGERPRRQSGRARRTPAPAERCLAQRAAASTSSDRAAGCPSSARTQARFRCRCTSASQVKPMPPCT